MPAALLLLLSLACTPADPDTGGDTGDTGEAEDPQLWLGLCDAWDAPSLERGQEDLEPLAAALDQVTAAGLAVARPHRPGGHVFAMSAVARPEGWDWSLTDYVVQRSGQAGARLFITLQPDLIRADGPEVAPFSVAYDQLDEWRDYVGEVVERYDGDGDSDMPGLRHPVLAWEVGNEPFCDPGDSGCPDAYLDTVRVAYQAAHEADPGATVALGGSLPIFLEGTVEVDPRATSIYEYFFEGGGEAWTDAMSIHVVTGRLAPPAVKHLEAWREHLPADVPLWLTESGPYDAEGTTVPGTPAEVAEWYVGQLEAVREAGVERALWCLVKHEPDDRPEVLDALAEYAATLDD